MTCAYYAAITETKVKKRHVIDPFIGKHFVRSTGFIHRKCFLLSLFLNSKRYLEIHINLFPADKS